MFLAIANSISSLIKPYISKITSALAARSDYYENIKGTNNILFDFGVRLLDKASIVLTPTAYSDGSLNTVIPPYQVLPTELVTNGTFDNNIDNWAAKSSVISWSNGKLSCNNSSGNYLSGAYQAGVWVDTKNYKVTVTMQLLSGDSDGNIMVLSSLSNGSSQSILVTGNELKIGGNAITQTFYLTPSSSDVSIQFACNSSNAVFTIDNVSVKEIQEADFDFSRGSSATRVNEQGLVEDVQILSGELVQNGDFEQIGAEEVTNGNFETDSDWTKGTGWSIGDGKAIATNTSSFFKQNSVVTNNKIYKVTFNATVDSGRFRLVTTADAGTYTSYITADGSYTFYMKPTVSINGGFEFVGDGYTGSIDNVSVKEVGQNWSFGTGWSIGNGVALFDSSGNAGYITQSGALEINKKYKLTATVNSGVVSLVGAFYDVEQGAQIQTGADSIFTVKSANGSVLRLYSHPNNGDAEITDISVIEITDDTDLPRIDYTDGTGSLLLEPQSTNVITYSEDFSQSIWRKEDVLIESGYTAPDGTNTAYKVTENGSDAHLVILGSSISPVNRHKSIWARTVSGTGTIQLLNHNTDTGNIFTLTTQWQRFDLAHSGLNHFYAVDFRLASTTLSEVVLWGAQMEDLSYATSYIPTSGSTVTRSADIANNSGNADLFNDSEGVLYAEIAALANDSTNRSISISDSTDANRIELRLATTDDRIQYNARTSSVTQASIFTDDYDVLDFNKIALLYKENDFRLFVNGTQVASDTSGTAPTGLKELAFDLGDGSNDFYGDVKCVAVFKEALSNDLLERLTGEGYESFRLLAEANNYTVI